MFGQEPILFGAGLRAWFAIGRQVGVLPAAENLDRAFGVELHAENARYFTDAILDTELSGLEGHGFYWLQYYCEHLHGGKVDRKAKPSVMSHLFLREAVL